MRIEYARNVILDIYEEGDLDVIFLGQIVGLVVYDGNDRDRSRSAEQVARYAVEVI